MQRQLGTQSKISSTFHPQTNGQPKSTIDNLEDILQDCVIDFSGHWD